MEEILWRHSFENDAVVTALPVSEDDIVAPSTPALIRAKAEAVAVE